MKYFKPETGAVMYVVPNCLVSGSIEPLLINGQEPQGASQDERKRLLMSD
jgi:hypothetical protein